MKKIYIVSVLLLGTLLCSCGRTPDDSTMTVQTEAQERKKPSMEQKQGVYYEIFVRSYADSDGDGVGDFNGVTAHLKELKELGVDGIWLMPVQASDSYHGYDVVDYKSVNSQYGSEEDFQRLIDTAHKLDLKVTMDFVANHTSSQHPWFLQALADKKSPYRSYYHFVTPKDKQFSSTAKSPWASNLWNPAGDGTYYYAMFYDGMPDLNYDNLKVRQEIKGAAAKWLKMGVDGFRLDAALYVYGNGESTTHTNLTKSNIEWWSEFGAYCESINPDVMLTGEVWCNEQIMEDYAKPFDSKFDFTLAAQMLKCVNIEDPEGLTDTVQTIQKTNNQVDTRFIDSTFASNHDQDRILNQVENFTAKARLIASVYLTLPGNPYIYYGEELGMLGSGKDEMRRTPYLWGTKATTSWEEDPQNSKTPSLATQKKDKQSMYWHYRNLLAMRKKYKALQSGNLEPVEMDNVNLCGYERVSGQERVQVIHNFYEEPQEITVPEEIKIIYGEKNVRVSGKRMTLQGYETVMFEVEN